MADLLRFEKNGMGADIVILRVPAELVENGAKAFFRDAGKELEKGKRRIVLDLSETKKIDPIGIGECFRLIASARLSNGNVYILAPSKEMDESIKILKLKSLVEVFPNFESLQRYFLKQ